MKNNHKTILFAKNFYLQQELSGIADFARNCNWHLEIPQMFDLHDHIRNWYGDALITDTPFYLDELISRGVKIVSLSMNPELVAKAHITVGPDNHAIGVQAADYFLSKGYKNFVCFHDFDGRDIAFSQRLKERGFKAATLTIPRFLRTPGVLQTLVDELKKLPTPCAVFGSNAWEARIIFDAAVVAGKKVPEDIAVIGGGYEELICGNCQPQISSVDTRLYERGCRAAKELDELFRNPDMPQKVISIPPGGVIERVSSNFYAVSDEQLQQMMHFLQQHASSDIKISQLASIFHSSESKVFRKFQTALGVSPKTFLTEYRLSLAAVRLRENKDKISTVALECGFPTECIFFQQFKKKYNMTPKEWQDKNKL